MRSIQKNMEAMSFKWSLKKEPERNRYHLDTRSNEVHAYLAKQALDFTANRLWQRSTEAYYNATYRRTAYLKLKLLP